MDEAIGNQTQTGSLTPERVAASAIQQAARHERALQACLEELRGIDEPADALREATRRRALRHAERAIGLTRTAIRLNRDPLAEAFFAALLEQHERNAMAAQRLSTAVSATLSMAG